MRPEVALTLDDGQHGVGPVQGDGQAQRPQVPLLVEQVVELLLPGGQGGDRAQGPWGTRPRLTPPGASRVAAPERRDQRADSKLGGRETPLT